MTGFRFDRQLQSDRGCDTVWLGWGGGVGLVALAVQCFGVILVRCLDLKALRRHASSKAWSP